MKTIVIGKLSKSSRILRELKRKKKQLELYCELNDAELTDYMRGSKRVIDDMMLFVKRVIKDEQNN